MPQSYEEKKIQNAKVKIQKGCIGSLLFICAYAAANNIFFNVKKISILALN
jgi:hypothetical protein